MHRNGVLRLDDKDGDGVSESRATILEMQTPANYPHNGLGAAAFGPDSWLYVGQGENLGERYTLKGSDGSAHRGKGEGGNVFRCGPMANGTGEGACALLPCDQTQLPSSYRGSALVTAAREHQVEIHRLKPFGASLRSDREVLMQGEDDFRPVGIAAAPDRSVFIAEWVDASYNVHCNGRIWRLTAKSGSRSEPSPSFVMRSILHPSCDIALQFVGHTVETKDGQSFTGLLTGQSTEEV